MMNRNEALGRSIFVLGQCFIVATVWLLASSVLAQPIPAASLCPPIPIRFMLPDPGYVTLVIEDRSLRERTHLDPTNWSAVAPETLVDNLEDPQNLTLDARRNIYVSDRGGSHQVKVYSAQGTFLPAIGRPGAPAVGHYNPNHMSNPDGITIDDRGRLWVAKTDFQPKRVSVWDINTGKLWKAFYGGPGYGSERHQSHAFSGTHLMWGTSGSSCADPQFRLQRYL